jgi:hypothetical protein
MKPRTPENEREWLLAIAEQVAEREGQSDEEVAADLRDLGLDPAKVVAGGLSRVRSILDAERLSWQAEARNRVARMRAVTTAAEEVDEDASEAELEAELSHYRRDPAIGPQIEASFSKRTGGALSVEELRLLVARARQALLLAKAKKQGGL